MANVSAATSLVQLAQEHFVAVEVRNVRSLVLCPTTTMKSPFLGRTTDFGSQSPLIPALKHSPANCASQADDYVSDLSVVAEEEIWWRLGC